MIFVHIGTHKTGSTSIQKYLADNSEAFGVAGYDVYESIIPGSNNHSELHLACLRSDRDSFGKWRRDGQVEIDERYRCRVHDRVRAFLSNSALPHQVLSNESLSWLRYPEEFLRLRVMLCGDRASANNIVFVLFLRDRLDFLKSYRAQIYKVEGRAESDQENSVFYVGAGSWVADFDSLISAYRTHFPDAELLVQDYDDAVAQFGSVIPVFNRAIGLRPEIAPPWNDYYLNRT